MVNLSVYIEKLCHDILETLCGSLRIAVKEDWFISFIFVHLAKPSTETEQQSGKIHLAVTPFKINRLIQHHLVLVKLIQFVCLIH